MNRASRFTVATFLVIALGVCLAVALFVLALGGALDGPFVPSD